MKLNKLLITAVLVLFGQTALAGPFSYDCTDCPLPIPTGGGSDGETMSTISVADSGAIADITVFIDAFHTFQGDLTITLEHAGTTALLFDGSGADDYMGGTYDVTADFAGADLMGDWDLLIVDQFGGDTGVLTTWNISGNAEMAQVAEPGMLVLVGMGLLGMGVARRRA